LCRMQQRPGYSQTVFFVLSIRARAKSILDPVTMYICESDKALPFKQSQAINLSMNSDTTRPVAFLIQRRLPLDIVLPL